MKKLLTLSTALALTAGAASADVSVSGDARVGITNVPPTITDAFKNDVRQTAFAGRVRMRLTGTGETDSGLKFGGQFRITEASDAGRGTAGTAFVDFGPLGRLTAFDTEGAVQAAVGQFTAIGFDEAQKLQELSFLTGGATSKGMDLLYTYTKDALKVHVSMGDPATKWKASGTTVVEETDQTKNFADDFGIGLSYTTEFWRASLGYENDGAVTQTMIGGSYGNGQFEVRGAYGMASGDAAVIASRYGLTGTDQATQYGLFATYIMGKTTLQSFHRKDFRDDRFTGIGFTRDMGANLVVSGAYAMVDRADPTKSTDPVMSLGVTLSF